MKKKCFLLVVLTLVAWFSFSHLANAKEKGKLFRVPHDQPRVIQKGNPEAEQTKRERYIQERDQKEEKHARLSSIAREEQPEKPNAVDIALDSTYIYFQPDYSDDLVITGMCHNAGTSSAVFVKVHFNLYDSNWNFIGYDYSYVWGGSNSHLTSSGIYTNALGAGDYGFFKVWTNYDYNNVKYWNYWFTWDTYAHTAAYAKLAFDGDVSGYDYLGNLALSGLIKNSSSSYVTYFTKTAFAVFNTSDTSVVDVDFSYVNGSTYNYGIGSTDTAIYPYESRPFQVTFPEATYSGTSDTFLYAFEWDEARASSLPEKDPPFGSYDTPIDGSTVVSSIPVTGWALDDTGVEHVKIYRKSGGTLVYIGDAQFVEAARPDVAAAYPQYPNKTKAGWGYMMLTNFLPDGGNGTFVIYAIATDGVGKTTTLGTKTIYCDNAHAVKPFGAIDTPTQGGTASGDSFINWGWVLTPLPNYIPTDGSTLNVYVDGVNIGHPTYNVYRDDIANLFQGYANSNGAIGYFYLDTTAYSNGVHTIQWAARDSAGNSDGIGSRYFSISNTGSSRTGKISHTYQPKQKTNFRNFSQIIDLPVDYSAPVRVKRGYKEDVITQEVQPDETGINRVVIYELERVVIYLSGKTAAGYHVVNNGLVELPVGSTLNREKGIFYWQPGPGYLGRYRLVFVETAADGTMTRKNIIVEIVPQK